MASHYCVNDDIMKNPNGIILLCKITGLSESQYLTHLINDILRGKWKDSSNGSFSSFLNTNLYSVLKRQWGREQEPEPNSVESSWSAGFTFLQAFGDISTNKNFVQLIGNIIGENRSWEFPFSSPKPWAVFPAVVMPRIHYTLVLNKT